MRKKKIAICLRDMRIGGVESVFVRMADALLKTGKYELVFISYVQITNPVYAEWFAAHPDVEAYALYPSKYLGTDLPHFFLRRIFRSALRGLYRWWRRMTLSRRRFADVDVFIDFYDMSFVREFKKFRAPKIAWWHSSIKKFLGGDYAHRAAGYDTMVALTDGFIFDLAKTHPDVAAKTVRIYNPIDIDSVVARAAESPCGGKYFSYVARLDGDKDAETVIRAFDMFWRGAGGPDVDLVIVGDGHLARELKSLASKMAAHEHIVFTGVLSNPFGVMAGAMANILSSYGEGLPTVLIEGLALGVTEIASDCPNGPAEILENGGLGLLFRPGMAHELAAHMNSVYQGARPATPQQMRESMSRFDMDSFTRSVENLIENIR